MNINLLVFILLLACLIASNSFGQNVVANPINYTSFNEPNSAGSIGIGLQVGSLSGVNIEYWASTDRTWNAIFAIEHLNSAIGVAHHWMLENIVSASAKTLPYIGLGMLEASGTESDIFSRNDETHALAAQVPLGFEYLPSQKRYSIFAEVDPSLEISPVATGFFTVDFGGKYYF
jgi:hypothetical protein